jgi:hypothetical protein
MPGKLYVKDGKFEKYFIEIIFRSALSVPW